MIRFSPLAPAEIENYLTANKLAEPSTARLRARAAAGSISRALAGDVKTFTAQRKAMITVVEALVASPDHAQLLRSAEQLNEAQYKDEYEARLDVLETLIRDAWMLALGSDREQLVNVDLVGELEKISRRMDPTKAAAWILEIEDMREQLIVNINRKVATDSLFLTMASGEIPVKRFSVK